MAGAYTALQTMRGGVRAAMASGVDAGSMRRLFALNVLVSGMDGLGVVDR